MVADDFYLRWQIKQYMAEGVSEEDNQSAATERETNEPVEMGGGPDRETPVSVTDSRITARQEKNLRIAAAVLALPVAMVLALSTYLYYGNSAEYSLKLICIFEMLIPAALLDGKFHRIPNRVVLAGLVMFVLFFLYEWLGMHENLIVLLCEAFFGLLLGGGVFILCGILARNGLGAGDIKLFSVLGLLMTWRGVFNMIFFSVLFIAAYGVFQLATKRMTKNSQIAMGPFTLLAMGVVILLGI